MSGVNQPEGDIDRVKSHLAKYYKKMGEEAPWERDSLDCEGECRQVRPEPIC
jgi:hypothetical protein